MGYSACAALRCAAEGGRFVVGSPSTARSPRQHLFAPGRLAILAVAVGVGLLAILLFAHDVTDSEQVVGSAIIFSIAALVAGGLVGFLFGIPHALTADGSLPKDGTPAAATGHYAANTNLEQ